MAALTNLKNVLSTALEHEGDERRKPEYREKWSPLLGSLTEETESFATSAADTADWEKMQQMDNLLSLQLEESLVAGKSKPENTAMTANDATLKDNAQTPAVPARLKEAEVNTSVRILEIRRKQEACGEMRSKIQDSTSVLNTLSKQAELLSAYLAKSEQELAKLETKELEAADKSSELTAMVRKCKELEAALDDHKQQIVILENAKSANREAMEKANFEIARLAEEGSSRNTDIQGLRASVARLEDTKASLAEKIDLQAREIEDLRAEKLELKEKLGDLVASKRETDRDLANATEERRRIRDDREQVVLELKELGAKYKELNARHMEQASKLEEANFQLAAAQNDFEEKLRLKDNRILKLESKLEAAGAAPEKREEDMTSDDIVDAVMRKRAASKPEKKSASSSAETGENKRKDNGRIKIEESEVPDLAMN